MNPGALIFVFVSEGEWLNRMPCSSGEIGVRLNKEPFRSDKTLSPCRYLLATHFALVFALSKR